ncbi:Aldose reductase [Giardia lamblia P15]|uniref:Aldose reductase n=1 Tax=Giardia intestinalis (strain P15) TaxID=658858 RepID=E1F9G7_GIAIA|nr:Aldose reductase [Giardia lamblia P15]
MLDRPPCVGFGTYLVEDPEAIRNAIKLGYRHFDCAYRYGNERMIGEVFKEIFNDDSYGVKREDLWIVSKLWPNFHEPEKVAYQIAETLRDLQLEYLDVFLMHWPLAVRHLADGDYASSDGKEGTLLGTTPIRKTWEAMEACVDKKQTRFIGVSNMGTAMLIDLLSYCRIKPFTNQFESQPYFPNDRLIEFCNSNGIYVTAYRPLGGRCRDDARAPLTDPALEELAKKANLAVSELILAWHWTRWGTNGTYSVIPKSNNQERQRQNLESVKLRLTPDQMDAFARLGCVHQRTCFTSFASVPLFD